MKIIYYSPHPYLNLASPAGYGTHMREIIKAFRGMGHEVQTHIMGGEELSAMPPGTVQSGGLKSAVKALIPPLVWTSLKDLRLMRFDAGAQASLEQLIQSFQPDLIYERAAYLQTSGVRAAAKFNVPHILEVNSPYVEETEGFQGKSWYKGKARKVEREQLELTHRVVVVSTALKDYFMKQHRIPAEKFAMIPNAIDLGKIKTNEQEVAKLRQQHGLDNQLVVGFVGSLFPWHGVDELIKAFARLKRQDAKLIVVGSGEMFPELEKLAAQRDVTNRVIFTGNLHHEEVFNYIECMDITVMAKSNWYGSPVKIFEYGAMGKAIVAPDNGPVNDVMTHEQDGLLVPPDTDALTAALSRLADDADLRSRLGATFCEKVNAHHQWHLNAERAIEGLSGLPQE